MRFVNFIVCAAIALGVVVSSDVEASYLFRHSTQGTSVLPEERPAPLYEFSSHTFSNCGQTGNTGPSQSMCVGSYSAPWSQDSELFSVSGGKQVWTVPETGNYFVRAAGAQGGCSGGGGGAVMRGEYSLTKGDSLVILVGQQGGCYGANGGGGGASFVQIQGDTIPLVVAGGGAGAGGSKVFNATTSTNADSNPISTSCGGSGGGSNGGGGGGGANYGSGGGAGWYGRGGAGGFSAYYVSGGSGGDGGDGSDAANTCLSRAEPLSGAATGAPAAICYHNVALGGFGGGGFGSSGNDNGGGGGGWSGGAGGAFDSCAWSPVGGQTGGASYSTGVNQSNNFGNTGHGHVYIEKLSS